MKGRLFDASAVVNIMVNRGSEATKFLKNHRILDLTIYEVGNSIWKLCYLEKITYDEACKFLRLFLSLAQHMTILSIDGIEENVKKHSVEKGLTFYDASYVAVSENQNLLLVTDDDGLAKVASKHGKVMTSDDL
ncbi:MAG: type II toxin-antitoxin system VapC family toxin [Nitrososphaerales archaeon]